MNTRQYEQEAQEASELNQQSETQISETEGVVTQTEARIEEMHAANVASNEKIENAMPGPALIRRHSRQTAQSGDQLIAATIVMEQELNDLQSQYMNDMAGIDSRRGRHREATGGTKRAGRAKIPTKRSSYLNWLG